MITRIRLEAGFAEEVEQLQDDLNMAEAAMLRDELKLMGYFDSGALTDEEKEDDKLLLASGLVSGTQGDQLGRRITDEVFQRQGDWWTGRRVVSYDGILGEDEERLDFHVEDFTQEPGNSHVTIKAGGRALANVPLNERGDWDDAALEEPLLAAGYSMKEIAIAEERLNIASGNFRAG